MVDMNGPKKLYPGERIIDAVLRHRTHDTPLLHLRSGLNADIDIASVPEEVWRNGGVVYRPTAAVALEIAASIADIGERILIRGIGPDWVEQEAYVTLNGQTPVAVDGTWLRVNSMELVSGTLTTANYVRVADASGDWTAGVPDDLTEVMALIYADEAFPSGTFFATPAGAWGYITEVSLTVPGVVVATAAVNVTRAGQLIATYPIPTFAPTSLDTPILVPPQCDATLVVLTSDTDNSSFSATMKYVLSAIEPARLR